jgi:tetratricopeptide (TPR) repeat protein
VEAEQVLVGLNNDLAEQYFDNGAFDKSVAALDRVIVLDPSDIEPYATAAWLLWSSRHTQEAIAHYDRMIAANPDNPMGYFEYGFYYMRINRNEDAVKLLARAEQLGGLPSPQRHMYGHVLERLGRNAEALAFWRRVAVDDPKDTVAQQAIKRLTDAEKTPAVAPPPASPAPSTPPTTTPPTRAGH